MGLMAAVVLKHLDAVMKTLASAVATAITTGFSYFFFGSPISRIFVIGAVVVVISLWEYNDETGKNPQGHQQELQKTGYLQVNGCDSDDDGGSGDNAQNGRRNKDEEKQAGLEKPIGQSQLSV